MTIIREEIEARLVVLHNERQRLFDNVNAYNGAISELQRLLSEADKLDVTLNGRLTLVSDGERVDE